MITTSPCGHRSCPVCGAAGTKYVSWAIVHPAEVGIPWFGRDSSGDIIECGRCHAAFEMRELREQRGWCRVVGHGASVLIVGEVEAPP